MNSKTNVLLAISLLTLSASALAQKAGSWSASLGVTRLSPSVTSGSLTPPSFANTTATVNSDTEVTGAVTYMLTDNWALHVPLGLGFKHEVTGTGAIAGVGKIADTRALPITALAHYRFGETNAQVRPYAGLGLTYAKFYKTNGTGTLTALTNPGGPATTVSFDNKLAVTFELGAVININEKWFIDATYTKTKLKTRGTLSTGQTLDMTLDPNAYTLGVGYKF